MPNIKSAKKRVLVNNKKKVENKMQRSQVSTAIKKINAAIDANDIATAEILLPTTMSILDSAASAGIIHPNNAANKKSAIARRISMVKTGKLVIVKKLDNKQIAAAKAKVAKEAKDVLRVENAQKAAVKAAAKLENPKKPTAKAAPKAAEKPTKVEKAPKTEKVAKVEKTVKTEKVEKAEKPVKTEKAPKAKKEETK